MTGYQLLTVEQREELDNLTERREHSDTMVFTALDQLLLNEYNQLMLRLEREYSK